jgi:hypothetical protein
LGDDRELCRVPERLPFADRLIDNTEYESLLTQATTMNEYYRPHFPYEPFESQTGEYLQHRFSLARAEEAAAARLWAVGRFQDAVRRLLRLHRIGRKWMLKESSMQEVSHNMAICGDVASRLHRLLRGPVRFSPTLHDEIEREFAGDDFYRALSLREAQSYKLEAVELYNAVLTWQKPAFFKPMTDAERAFIVRFQHRYLRTCLRPYTEVREELERMQSEVDPKSRREEFIPRGRDAVLKCPVLARTVIEHWIVRDRCMRIINAWARKRDFNADLESLGLPMDCLTDPYNGERLKVRRTPKGPVIYSVGPNLIDDGGIVDGSQPDVGSQPPEPESDR